MLDTIKLNDNNNLVEVAQYLMNYAAIKQATSFFDEKFQTKVMEWQSLKHLAADGIIGKNTWTELAKSAPTCSTSKNKKSVYTCALQILLGGLTVDGIYGNNTKNAVVAFQNTNKMKADGICGPKTWSMLIIGKDEEKPIDNRQPIDYKQYDKRWKDIEYSTHTASQTIGNSGCGPTAMADIVATWWDSSITPVEMCELSTANGFRTYNSGTAWGYFKFCADYFGANKFIQTTSIAVLKSALQEGAYAIVSFGSSKWTKQG